MKALWKQPIHFTGPATLTAPRTRTEQPPKAQETEAPKAGTPPVAPMLRWRASLRASLML